MMNKPQLYRLTNPNMVGDVVNNAGKVSQYKSFVIVAQDELHAKRILENDRVRNHDEYVVDMVKPLHDNWLGYHYNVK